MLTRERTELSSAELASKRKREKVLRGVGKVGLGAMALAVSVGPGLAIGNYFADQAKVEVTESETQLDAFKGRLETSKETISGREKSLATFMNTLSEKCAKEVKLYLVGGNNKAFSTETAQLLVVESQACVGQPNDLISNLRGQQASISGSRQNRNEIEAEMGREQTNLNEHMSDAESNREVATGIALNLGVGLMIAGIAMHEKRYSEQHRNYGND